MKHLMVLMVVLGSLGLGAGFAVSAEKEKAASPVNSKCPVGGREANAKKTVVYKGETIALCCNKCLAKFEADPEKYAKDIERDLKKKEYTKGSCCDKAAKKGEACAHPCCVAAEKEGKVCTKCNKPKKDAKEAK
jgi:YHS domain-containing protein